MTSNTEDEKTKAENAHFDAEEERKKAALIYAETMRIFAVVGFYFFVSIALVFLNKNMMSDEFKYPLFVTWWQLIIALIMVAALGEMGKSYKALSMIPPIEFDVEVAKKVLPLAGIFVGMVAFNNLCLAYVEVTFYQVVRSLTICFTIFFTYAILGQKTSMGAIQASAIVMIGFVIGSIGEVNFSWIGVFYGVSSSAFVSLYSIYVKKVMEAVGNDQWRLLIYNNALSMVLLLPFIFLFGEFSGIVVNPLIYELKTWFDLTVTGVFGFLINIAVFLQIKFTSPLTNNISGTLKACVQTLLAILIYQNPITSMNALGIILVIGGSAYYSSVRYAEMKAKTAEVLPTRMPTK